MALRVISNNSFQASKLNYDQVTNEALDELFEQALNDFETLDRAQAQKKTEDRPLSSNRTNQPMVLKLATPQPGPAKSAAPAPVVVDAAEKTAQVSSLRRFSLSQMLTIAPNSRIRQPRFIALVGTVAALTAASAALAAKVGPLAAAALIAGHTSTAATVIATNTTVLAPLIAAHTITFLTPGVVIVGGAVKLAVSATAVTTATVVMPFLMPVISTVVVGAAITILVIILAIYLVNKMIEMIQAAITAAGKALDENLVGRIVKKAVIAAYAALMPSDDTDTKPDNEVAPTTFPITTLGIEQPEKTPQMIRWSFSPSSSHDDDYQDAEEYTYYNLDPNSAF